MQPQQTGQAPYQQARPAGQKPMGPVPVQPMQAAPYQQVRQQPLPPVAQVQRPAFTPAARLPLPSSRSLARGWQKFYQIIRYGKVGTPSGTEPVQQVSLLWTAGGIDSRQLGAEEREAIGTICTEGAPTCSMRLKASDGVEDHRSGPLFQLTVVVQVQGKQMLDKRHVCFSKGVALLEKPLPRDGKVAENSTFQCTTRRSVKFKEPNTAECESAAAATAQCADAQAVPQPKASWFCWRGRNATAVSVAAGQQQRSQVLPADECARLSVTACEVPEAFKWRNQGSVPECRPPVTSVQSAGKKRGRDDGDCSQSMTQTTVSGSQGNDPPASKRIKICPIQIRY